MAEQKIQFGALGMNLDSSKIAIGQGELTYILNGLITEKGFIQNEDSNTPCTDFPTNEGDPYFPIGHVNLDDSGETVYFLVEPIGGGSEIGVVDKFCNYTTIVNDPCLNFSIEHQIRAVYRPSSNCGRNIYWTDDFNPMRWIDIDNLDEPFDCDKLKVFPDMGNPCISIANEVVSGGSLHSGVYQGTIQYADINGNPKGSPLDYTNPYPIIKDNLYATFQTVEGSPADTATSKAIKFEFSGLNTDFDYFNLIVVSRIDGIVSAQKVITLPTGTTEYIYTGNESSIIDITIDEAIAESPVYLTAKELVQTNKRLFWFNLTERQQFNYQPYANQIQVNWVTKKVPFFDNKNNYKNPYRTTYTRTFMRDEIYALGIRLIFLDGTKSCVYHIPGRSKNKTAAGDFITIETDQYGNSINGDDQSWDTDFFTPDGDNFDTSTERWQMYNTAYEVDSYSCEDEELPPGNYGEMAYWESSLSYPNDPDIWNANVFGHPEWDLAGTPIRHHKFPDCSVVHIHTGKDQESNISDLNDNTVALQILGINVSNVQIPMEITDQVLGWEIVVGDRKGNESIIAKGLVNNIIYHDEAINESIDAPIYYNNYPYNDVTREVDLGTSGTDVALQNMYAFLSPECGFRSKSISGAVEFKVESEEIGAYDMNKYADADKNEDRQITYSIDSTCTSFSIYSAYVLPQYTSVRRELVNKEYILNNTNQQAFPGVVVNAYREGWVMLETGTDLNYCTGNDDSKASLFDTSNGTLGTTNASGDLAAYYVSIKNNSTSLYGELNSINYRPGNPCAKEDTSASCIFDLGDCFINAYSFHNRLVFQTNDPNPVNIWTSNPEIPDGSDVSEFTLIPLLSSGTPFFFVESTINVDYRYGSENKWEQVFPTFDNYTFFRTNTYEWQRPKYTWLDVDNFYGYDEDYSALNDLRILCNSPIEDLALCNNEHPTRAIYSEQQSEEGLFDNYLVYLPNSLYDYPREDKEIWQAFASGDTLFVRTLTNIYQHRLNFQQLNTDVNNIIVGTGALFAIPPTPLSKVDNGYGGTTNQWVLNLTPFGYFFCDSERGTVFQFEQGLNEISQNKAFRFFKDNLITQLDKIVDEEYGPGSFVNKDNPANPNGIGLLSAWDNKYKRWILTKRDYIPLESIGFVEDDELEFNTEDGRFYFNEEPVELGDPDFFCDNSFTISYSPLTKHWVSFHSYLPLYYNSVKDGFMSTAPVSDEGVNIHSHFSDLCSWQTFYDELKPFIVEVTDTLNSYQTFTSPSIVWTQQEEQCTDDSSIAQRSTTFNKAYVYNENQHSGMLNLSLADENALNTILSVPIDGTVSRNIYYSDKENTFSFSDFEDINKYPDKKVHLNTSSCDNADFISNYPIDKVPNTANLDFSKPWYERERFRGNWISYRLIQDLYADTKIITNFFLTEPKESLR